jgi:hypothetical protein
MRTNKYFGTFWIVFQGKNPHTSDDILSIRFENLWILKKEFNLFSLTFDHGFKITLLSFTIKFY